MKPLPEIRTFSDLILSIRAADGEIDVIDGTGLLPVVVKVAALPVDE